MGNLTLIGSTLYGTAENAGTLGGYGTIFSVPISGGTPTSFGPAPTVLASFNDSNGSYPNNDLMAIGTTLYGTTLAGGFGTNGTVFSVDTVPEPSSIAMLGLGLALGSFSVRKRIRKTGVR